MVKARGKKLNRWLAALLAVLMVISMSPLAWAAEATGDCAEIVLTFKDKDGENIPGVSIALTVGEGTEETLTADENGVVTLIAANTYTVTDPATVVNCKITADGYDETTKQYELSTTAVAEDVVLTKALPEIEDVQIFGKTLEYTGEEREAVTVTEVEGDVVTYKLDGEVCGGIPKVTDVKREGDAVASYAIEVTVERAGYQTLTKTVYTVVYPKEITGVTLNAIEGLEYKEINGAAVPQQLVTLEGASADTDTLVWTVDGAVTGTEDIPTASAVRNYKVQLTVDRGPNYQKFVSEEVVVTLNVGTFELGDDLKITGLDGEYTGAEQDAVILSGEQGDYELWYQLGEKDQANVVAGENWQTTIPTVTDAGSYIVWVKAVKTNYKDVVVEVDKAANAVIPFNVYVAKKSQSISFEDTKYVNGGSTSTSSGEAAPFESTAYNFAIKQDPALVGQVSYSINVGAEIATITDSGFLSVKQPGVITVTAKLSGDTNHAECEISYTLTVGAGKKEGAYIGFEKAEVEYVLGTNEGTASELVANKTQSLDDGVISYTVDSGKGLTVDSTGKVTVSNYSDLIAAMNAETDKVLDVTVTANKAAEKLNDVDIYPADTASYTLHIAFADIPENPVALSDANEKGWYKGNVTVTPATGYTICLPENIGKAADGFSANVEITDEGNADRTVYLRNDNGITAPVIFNAKIDKTAPHIDNMYVQMLGEGTFFDRLGVIFGFYDPEVQIYFYVDEAYDVQKSDIIDINWVYSKDPEATPSIKPCQKGTITAKYNEKDKRYEGTLTLPKTEADQYRGTFAFTATDVAGNESDLKLSDGTIIVQDTISPTMSAEAKLVEFDAENPIGYYQQLTADGANKHCFYDSKVQYKIIVKEANFFIDENKHCDDVTVTVHKSADEWDEETQDWKKSEFQPEVEWTTDPKDKELHIGTFMLEEPGDYVVEISYKDKSANDVMLAAPSVSEEGDVAIDGEIDSETKLFTSEAITIDNSDPIIEHSFSGINTLGDEGAADDEQSLTIRITEHNFRPEEIEISLDIKDITDADMLSAADLAALENEIKEYLADLTKWTQADDNKNLYTITLTSGEGGMLPEGIYTMGFQYADYQPLNGGETTFDNEFNFVIDHTDPEIENIKINAEATFIDEFLETLTLGFYRPDVEVTLTATDNVSGVKSFFWKYIRQEDGGDFTKPQENVSESNLDTYALCNEIKNAADEAPIKQCGNTFTTTFTLPEVAAQQLRGSLVACAEDMYYQCGDASKTSVMTADRDGQAVTLSTIVIDSIAPNVKVAFSEPSRAFPEREDENTPVKITDAYYNGNIDVTITVKEINFYSEDVNVSYTVNGGEAVTPEVTWARATAEEGEEAPKDTYIGTFTLKDDGHYVVNVEYKDKSENIDEKASKYTSHNLTIDTVDPEIKVEYKNDKLINKLTDFEENERSYFDNTQTAKITLTEHNFVADEVEFTLVAKDITGQEIDIDKVCTVSDWSVDDSGDVHYITITYPGEANYTFDVAYTDLATNEMDDYATDFFTVDTNDAENLNVEYSTSILETVLQALSFGFYNAKVTVTLSAEDITAGVHSFNYSYINAAGVSDVNAQLLDQAIKAAAITYSDDALLATTTFTIPKKALGNTNQFNGTVEFNATDRSGNVTKTSKEDKRIVVDNIAPTATIVYNDPVNTEGTISYYNGDINATITVNEANFYAGDVEVLVTKNGEEPVAITPTWVDESVDVHVGTFTLTEDGHYFITINYSDKSSNKMETYTSNQLTIDTEIEEPTFTINDKNKKGNAGAYKDEVVVNYSYQDENFDNKTIKLERVNFDSTEDVTDQFIKASETDKGGNGRFSLDKKVLNDGIYTLRITMADKAGHNTDSSVTFTVNRFGSVYKYNDALVELINKVYTKSVGAALEITEYNADELLAGSLKIIITRDGEAVEHDLSANPEDYRQETESGWYEYKYTLDPSIFAEDGVYKVSLISSYATDEPVGEHDSTSVPENSYTFGGEQIKDTITFTVDDTAPEIRNIVNMEKSIVDIDKINDGKLNVKYTIVDVGGLKSIEITVNDQTVANITDFSEDLYSYSGDFDIMESNDTTPQKVRIVVTDLAGNVTNTDTDEFRDAHSKKGSAFMFFDALTVSRNHFVRWYANKPLFWGSIGGVIILAAAIWFFIAAKNKKKEETK